MKRLLPVVNPEVGYSIIESFIDDDEYNLKANLREIERENPTIADFIITWSEKTEDKFHSAFCGILVYQLLRSQAEADKMKREFKLS